MGCGQSLPWMHAFMFSKRGNSKKCKGYQGDVAQCLSKKAPSQGGAFFW
jgi:hypothetical protein